MPVFVGSSELEEAGAWRGNCLPFGVETLEEKPKTLNVFSNVLGYS